MTNDESVPTLVEGLWFLFIIVVVIPAIFWFGMMLWAIETVYSLVCSHDDTRVWVSRYGNPSIRCKTCNKTLESNIEWDDVPEDMDRW